MTVKMPDQGTYVINMQPPSARLTTGQHMLGCKLSIVHLVLSVLLVTQADTSCESPIRTLSPTTIVAKASSSTRVSRLGTEKYNAWDFVSLGEFQQENLVKSPKEYVEDYWIKDASDTEAYTNICMQLTAAAERKADTASQSLLKG